MFFTTEPFHNRHGFHNHLVLKIDGNSEFVKEFIEKHAPVGIIDVKPYDKELAGVFYTAKNKHKNKDSWDILGNKLKEEGLKL